MDFDEVFIAGNHQWERLKNRTDENDIYRFVKSGKLVLTSGENRFFKCDNAVIPITTAKDGRKDDGRMYIIKTVLTQDMEVHENIV